MPSREELEETRKANLRKQRENTQVAEQKRREDKEKAQKAEAERARRRAANEAHHAPDSEQETPIEVEPPKTIRAKRRFQARAQAPQTPPKKRTLKPRPKQVKKFEQELIDLFGSHKRLKPEQIAALMGLSFERDSKDRALITAALKSLVAKDLIVNNGGQFVQPYHARPDSEKDIAGVVEKGAKGAFVRPADPNAKPIPLEECNVPDRTVVAVRQNSDGSARIVRDRGDFEAAEGICNLVAMAKGIPDEFPIEVLAEVANATVPAAVGDRKDMRHIPFLTIDPDTAKDFDDAICVRKHGKNMRVMVAIADVGHYVRPGMAVYEEAMKRGNSTYLPGHTIPMLPETLSNDLCSLKPGQDRAAIVMTVDITPDGEMIEYEPTLALIRSRARLTYDEVQDVVVGKSEDPDVIELYNKYISKAVDAYQILLTERHDRGALDLNVKEQRIDVTQGNGFSFRLEGSNTSHGLIEELMILANRAAIATLTDQNKKVVVRAHAGPNERLLREKIPMLEKWGMEIDHDMTAEEMVHDIARQASGHKNGDKIRRTLIRVQSMAGYKAEPSRHFALALDNYGHFTSPIRRAADLAVHHLIQNGETKHPEAFTQEKLEEHARHWNETERRSEEAERECNQRLAARWVQGNMSERFNAKVVAIGEEEIAVRVDYPSIVTDIPMPTTKGYAVGDTITIQPSKANDITGIIEFKIASTNGQKSTAQEKAEAENRRQQGRHPRMKEQRTAPQAPAIAGGK